MRCGRDRPRSGQKKGPRGSRAFSLGDCVRLIRQPNGSENIIECRTEASRLTLRRDSNHVEQLAAAQLSCNQRYILSLSGGLVDIGKLRSQSAPSSKSGALIPVLRRILLFPCVKLLTSSCVA